METETELIKACCHMDIRAQKRLYEKYAPGMLSLCTRYIRDRDRSMDILHEGFMTIFRKIDSYSGAGSFEGWMKKIFVNTALGEIRKKDVLRFSSEVSSVEYAVYDTGNIIDTIHADELHRLIASMPDGFRIVFNMFALEGYTHKEIAGKLNISEGTSRSQYSRARAWLQEKLKNIENY